MKKMLAIVLFGLLAVGCAKKAVSTDAGEMGTEGTVTQEKSTSADGAGKAAGQGTGAEGVSEQEMATQKSFEKVFAGTDGETYSDVYFDYDAYNIKKEYEPVLVRLSNWMLSSGKGVLVEGHCDDRGTNEYNIALGDRRASSIKQFLVSSGIAATKIETVSYGEEKPQCAEKVESCWWRNRRAHFVLAE
jgi:peptidoglycan-associated lipoprotein